MYSRTMTLLTSALLFGATTMISPLAAATDIIVKLDAKINNTNKPIALYLRKGRYEIRPVRGVHSGWSVWERTNCTQARGCTRTMPTRFTGMHNNYYVSSALLEQPMVSNKVLPVVRSIPQNRDFSYFLNTPEDKAFEVTENRVYPDEASALAAARASTFTLSDNGRVYLALLDKSRISDNRGGMTLSIRKLAD